MKQHINILFLVAALIAPTLTHTIEKENKNNILGLNKRLDVDIDLSIITKCVFALNENKECQLDNELFKKDRDAACALYDTVQCEKMLNETIQSNENCRNIPKEVLESSPIILGMVYASVELACSHDEKDQYCPLSKINFEDVDENLTEEDELLELLYETCQSRQCTTIALNTTKKVKKAQNMVSLAEMDINEYTIDPRKVKIIEEYLESEQCNGNHSPKPINLVSEDSQEEDTTDSASSILRMSSVLLVGLLGFVSFILV